MRMKEGFWDYWIGNFSEQVSFWGKHLLEFRGRRVDLHKFVRADDEGCFHTHPAWAIRIILWGGYLEEVHPTRALRRWSPGMIGFVRPEYCHRIHRLNNGRSSYSLWIRGKKTHKIELVGSDWDVSKNDPRGAPLKGGQPA